MKVGAPKQSRSHNRSSLAPTKLLLKTSTARLDTPEHAQHTSSQPQPGILLDATLIRALLVPALVSLFGDWNWWMPVWAAKILRVEPSLPNRSPG